jgi:glycosyltransferase involved in cell wall biosynthesis
MMSLRKKTIGVFIVAKNEERDLPNALESVDWCDQIVVVDMSSIDKTSEIAKSYGAEVFNFHDVGFVEPALQFATEKMRTDYILRLDSDEIINLELKLFLQERVQEEKYEAFFLRRENYIFGRYSSKNRYYKDLQLRFWKKGSVAHTDQIHAIPKILTNKIYRAPVGAIPCILHFNQRTIFEYIEKLNRYTEKEPLSQMRFNGFAYEFFINFLLKMFLLVIKQKSFLNKTDLTTEFLTSTYHFVKYLKALERSRNLNVVLEYKKIARRELARIKSK